MLFTIAVNEWGWLDDSPMRKVKKPALPRGRVRFLSEDTTDGIDGERTRLTESLRRIQQPLSIPRGGPGPVHGYAARRNHGADLG